MLRKRTFDLISLELKGILGQIPNNDNNQKERKQLQILTTYVVKLQDGSTLTCHCTECVRAQETNTEIFACALSLVFILQTNPVFVSDLHKETSTFNQDNSH